MPQLPLGFGSSAFGPRWLAWSRTTQAADGAAEHRSVGEERNWIRRASGGDSDAFRKLVERYRDRAYETALRIVRSPEEAEEAAQDAFVRAWRALDGFREESRFSTWLYRIVTRCALDAAAKSKRRRDREGPADLDRIESPAAPGADPGGASDLRRLGRILGLLSPVQRAVVTLFYLRDRTVEETARILDLPPGTVKTHLHRSRRTLREAWLRQEGIGELPRL